MHDTAGEMGTNSFATYSRGPLHMDVQRQDDQLEPMYKSFVPIQYVALKTSRKRWTMETAGERGSGRYVLVVRHGDDDDDILNECIHPFILWVRTFVFHIKFKF